MSLFKRMDEKTLEIPLGSEHITLRAVKLVTNTDVNDTLVEERVAQAFKGSTEELSGQIFLLSDRTKEKATVII